MPSSARAALGDRLRIADGRGGAAAGGRGVSANGSPARARAAAAASSRPAERTDRRCPACVSLDQLRIAQNSSASPGNSPATCIATPPELLSCSHSCVGLIELEIREPRVIGDLPRRDGHGVHRHTGQLQAAPDR